MRRWGDARERPTTRHCAGTAGRGSYERVSVAFPFSHLHIEESSKELLELASITAHLASLVEAVAPSPEAAEARASADALAAKLH